MTLYQNLLRDRGQLMQDPIMARALLVVSMFVHLARFIKNTK